MNPQTVISVSASLWTRSVTLHSSFSSGFCIFTNSPVISVNATDTHFACRHSFTDLGIHLQPNYMTCSSTQNCFNCCAGVLTFCFGPCSVLFCRAQFDLRDQDDFILLKVFFHCSLSVNPSTGNSQLKGKWNVLSWPVLLYAILHKNYAWRKWLTCN